MATVLTKLWMWFAGKKRRLVDGNEDANTLRLGDQPLPRAIEREILGFSPFADLGRLSHASKAMRALLVWHFETCAQLRLSATEFADLRFARLHVDAYD